VWGIYTLHRGAIELKESNPSERERSMKSKELHHPPTVRRFSRFNQVAVGFDSLLHGYTPALIAIGIATVLHYIFVHTVGPKFAGILFVYIMAMLIAAWCGYGPGILVVIVIVAGLPFVYKSDFALNQVHPGGLAVVTAISVAVSRTAKTRRNAEVRLRATNEELDRRVAEQTVALEQANTTLAHRLAELETLYSKLSVGLCFVDERLCFVRTNDTFAAMSGTSVASNVGQPLRNVLSTSFCEVLEPLCRHVLATGQPILNYETRCQSTPHIAEERDWAISCSLVSTDDGFTLGVQTIVHDITERKHAERELKRANMELTKVNIDLTRANGDLEQFAYSASHDLREPLRMVAIYSQMLQKRFGGQLGPKGEQYISYTVQGATRMEQLVKDLLAYTRASSLSPDPAPIIDATEACKEALMNLEASILEHEATIEYDALPEIRMHRVHLEQLLQNLIGNAIKYRGAEPPKITVSAQQRGSEWLFCVEDNGIGIAPDYRSQVFGIFKRLHTATEYSGTGIGLAICQRVVERYGGEIWVESELGSGSKFFFTVPNAQGMSVSAAGTA
jgi:PAS domain S-box-containing protein